MIYENLKHLEKNIKNVLVESFWNRIQEKNVTLWGYSKNEEIGN